VRAPRSHLALLLVVLALAGGLVVATPRPAPAAGCVAATRPYGVGSTSVRVVRGDRVLPTTVLYPSRADRSGVGVPRACGRFPLVVAGHGSGGTGGSAATIHRFLAEQGYVVAAPTFPARFDPAASARDVSRVVTVMLRRDRRSSGILGDLLRRTRIGYTGTSMGGFVGFALYRSCCLDRRIDAVIPKLAYAPGSGYAWRRGAPLLMINGTADELIPYRQAVRTYEAARRPKGLVSLRGVDHGFDTGGDPVVRDVTLGFFGSYLDGRDNGLRQVRRAAKRSRIASLRARF
jgi:dienelactone hydrolase